MSDTAVYFKHGIGNLVMLSPALRALASMDPSGKVDICLSSHWNDSRRQAFDDIFTHWDIVDRVINYPKEKLPTNYTQWFFTKHSEASELFDIFQSKAKVTETIPDWTAERMHEILYYMRLVYKMGYTGVIPKQSFPKTYLDFEIIDELKVNKIVICLCNGTYSQGMKPAKQWRGFPELARTLRAYYGAYIVKVGFGDELKDVVADLDLVGKLAITQTARVLEYSTLFITSDTGLMHVADALEVNMLALFGGSLVSKNGPINRHSTVLTKKIACQPCQKVGPFYDCGSYDCLEKLTVGEVMRNVDLKL